MTLFNIRTFGNLLCFFINKGIRKKNEETQFPKPSKTLSTKGFLLIGWMCFFMDLQASAYDAFLANEANEICRISRLPIRPSDKQIQERLEEAKKTASPHRNKTDVSYFHMIAKNVEVGRVPFRLELEKTKKDLDEAHKQQEEERAHFSAQAASMAEEMASLKFQLAQAQRESSIFRSLYEQRHAVNTEGSTPSESGTQRPRSPSAMSEGTFSFVTQEGRAVTSEDEEEGLSPRPSRTPTLTSGLENNEI